MRVLARLGDSTATTKKTKSSRVVASPCREQSHVFSSRRRVVGSEQKPERSTARLFDGNAPFALISGASSVVMRRGSVRFWRSEFLSQWVVAGQGAASTQDPLAVRLLPDSGMEEASSS